MLARAFIPMKTAGTRMKKATSKEVMSSGVSNWYLLRMPPCGRVVLPGLKTLEVEGDDRSRVGRSVNWRLERRGEPEKMMRWSGNAEAISESSALRRCSGF